MRQSCMTSRSASRQIGAWHSWPERELRPFRPLLQHRRLDGKPPVQGLLERDTRSGSRSSVHCSDDGHHFSCVVKPSAGCFRSGSAHLRVKNGLACEHPLRGTAWDEAVRLASTNPPRLAEIRPMPSTPARTCAEGLWPGHSAQHGLLMSVATLVAAKWGRCIPMCGSSSFSSDTSGGEGNRVTSRCHDLTFSIIEGHVSRDFLPHRLWDVCEMSVGWCFRPDFCKHASHSRPSEKRRCLFVAQAVVTSWETGVQAESEVHDPACNDTTLVVRLPHPTVAMVSIEGIRLSLWRSCRRVYGNVLHAGHAMGLSLCDFAIVVRRYRRAQLEVPLSLERRRRIEATTFNLNAFSSQQSLSLFRFQPAHVGQLASLLDIDVPFPRTRLRVDPVECFCNTLRRLASPRR